MEWLLERQKQFQFCTELRKVRRLSIILVAFSALALSAVWSKGSLAAEIRLGLVPANIFTAPAYAAQKLNYYKDAGLDVKFIVFRGGPQRRRL